MKRTVYQFRSFNRLFPRFLPKKLLPWYRKKLDEFKDKFESLTDQERIQILTFLADVTCINIRPFRSLLRADSTTADDVFRALTPLADGYCRRSRDTAVLLRPSDAVHSGRSLSAGDEFNSFCTSIFHVLPHRFLVLFGGKFDEFSDKFKSLTDKERGQILTLLDGCPSECIRYFHRILDAGPTAVDTVFHALLILTGKNHAIEISPHGASASHSQGSDGLLSDSDDLVVHIPDSKLMITEYLIAKLEAQAAASKYLKLYEIMLPLNCSNAYQTTSILKSNFHSAGLPLSTKTSGYITVGLASSAVITSLAGFSLSIFKPETLPFGCSPRRMMKIMHFLALHATAYVFIWTMSHQFLLDDPIIMWIVAVLASALCTALMIFTGWRN